MLKSGLKTQWSKLFYIEAKLFFGQQKDCQQALETNKHTNPFFQKAKI